MNLFRSKTITSLKNAQSPLRCGFPTVLFALGLAWFGFFLPRAQAQDGNYGSGGTAEGYGALNQIVIGASGATGALDTAVGYNALRFNTTGGENTATGAYALNINTSGSYNTATGFEALGSNTADYNTATGYQALSRNTTASGNTAEGYQALYSNTVGYENTATGYQALYNNVGGTYPQGSFNTAHGWGTLYSNTSGYCNTGTGSGALYYNSSGYDNTADGCVALYHNTTGYHNTVNGVGALYYNTTGYANTANGWSALNTNSAGFNNTAEGFDALFHNTGSNNIAVGANAGLNLTTGSNNIDIGAPGTAGEANTIRIGKSGTQQKTFVAGIYGKTVASGVGVIIGSNGQLGTVQSSARFKDDIKPMDKASEAILSLQPVTFRYKQELDPDGIPQFGLVAEQVERVNPDLVVRDEDGKVMTVRYEAVNAMLLNEFLKEHRKVEEQGATIAQMKKQIETLTAGLQKVTARVEVSQPTAQVASEQ
jgi:Chaperone of endosialidase